MNSSARFFASARRAMLAGALALAIVGAARPASADPIPYPNSGSYNPVTYTFTTAATGDVIAYIVGGFSAGYENQLGLLINGVDTGIYGLDNKTSSAGDSINFGTANAGDTLTFVMQNLSLGRSAFSDPSMNGAYDDVSTTDRNRVYSTAYTATAPLFPGVPAGIYVAFEDLPFPFADYNYEDESFVFVNAELSTVPEPAALLIFGVGLVGLALRLKRRGLV